MLSEDIFAMCNTNCDEDSLKNGEKDSKCRTDIRDILVMTTMTCFACNGYYGPYFQDPICSTCHAFLFLATTSTGESVERPLTFDRSSDSDSDNVEPAEINSQESMPNIYEESVGRMVPVRVDTSAKDLQHSSVATEITDMHIELFPPEVLMYIFQYLEEVSLWRIGQVCKRWREILFMCVKFDRWREFVHIRWPLLPIENYEQDWYELYTAMMLSSCCLKCVQQMAAQSLPSSWEENYWRRNRLRSEIKTMRNHPLDGIEAVPLDSDCYNWQATIKGPAGSAYEGGLFFLYIQVPSSYPLNPPIVRFITKIFHPNVSRHGDIGIDLNQHNWSSALTISKMLISMQSLLTDPYCDVCMEPEVGNLYVRNRKAFDEQAKSWTTKHAMHHILPH